ncbi:hypothetical protein SAMN05421780_11032 [Flexibacter flexilis DSM 6793]|uniref:Uncharacterized protein n=1 Tax=Flexibacter flexilis DSM 6793 TaxID=927664 RepID=A0A1I1M5C6_9BACT|nr:hypothetical protein [Flexibacter flexilis]SFC80425.1 hypothetical protein SAMN05421780_11032 [Flexibacter flexilis DSM 6793]
MNHQNYNFESGLSSLFGIIVSIRSILLNVNLIDSSLTALVTCLISFFVPLILNGKLAEWYLKQPYRIALSNVFSQKGSTLFGVLFALFSTYIFLKNKITFEQYMAALAFSGVAGLFGKRNLEEKKDENTEI